MTYTALFFAWRKPGLSPAQFKTHYENTHMPIVQQLAGDLFPVSHTRFYIDRTAGDAGAADTSNANYQATTFLGKQEDFNFDSVATIVFKDADTFQRFYQRMSQPETAATLAADEELFLDRSKLTAAAIGETNVTRGQT